VREAREEREAARLKKAEADKVEATTLKKLAEAEAADAEKKRAEEAARHQSTVFVVPLNSALPPPEFWAQTGEAGDENPVMERDADVTTTPEVIVPPPQPSRGAPGGQPADLPVPPTGGATATGLTLEVSTPTRRRLAKAASAPRPLETGIASSLVPDTEVSSAAPTGWVRGGGTGPLNRALLDVQAKLRAEGDAIKECTKAYLVSRTAIWVRILPFCFASLFFFVGARQRTHWV